MFSIAGLTAFAAILLSIALLSPEDLNAQGPSDGAPTQAPVGTGDGTE